MIRKGDRPVTFTWLRDHHYLTANDDVQIDNVGGRTSILTLDPVRNHHQGNYTCLVTNAAGLAESSAVLLVNGSH